MRNVSANDEMPSRSEIGAASASTADTGRPLAKLAPMSPRSTPESHRAYCTGMELSSPRSPRSRVSSAWDAPGGSRKAAGSPGARRTSTNVNVATSQINSSAEPMRRANCV